MKFPIEPSQEWSPWIRAGAVAAAGLTLSFASVWATPGGPGCAKYSSALDSFQYGGKFELREDARVLSDAQYAIFQAGTNLRDESQVVEDQAVCYLWVDQKSGGKSLDAKRSAMIGSSGKEFPHCIYDKSCRYVAFPLFEEGTGSVKLKTLICENRKQALSMEDVKAALGAQANLAMGCRPGESSGSCVPSPLLANRAPAEGPEGGASGAPQTLLTLGEDNKYCREAYLASVKRGGSPSRMPASSEPAVVATPATP